MKTVWSVQCPRCKHILFNAVVAGEVHADPSMSVLGGQFLADLPLSIRFRHSVPIGLERDGSVKKWSEATVDQLLPVPVNVFASWKNVGRTTITEWRKFMIDNDLINHADASWSRVEP